MKKRTSMISRLIDFARPIMKWLLLGGLLDVLAVVCAVVAPAILGDIVQYLFDHWSTGLSESVIPKITKPLIILFTVYALHSLLSYLSMRLMNQVVSRHLSCGLRIAISEKIKKLPVSFVDQTPVGDILRRTIDDVSEVGGYLHQIFDTVIKGVFQIILISVFMFMEDWRLAVFVIIFMPISILLSSWIASKSEKHYDGMFECSGKLTEYVEEAFSNFSTTKAYNLEEHTSKKHGVINDDLYESTVRANFAGSVVQPLIKLINAVSYILISLIGGWLIVGENVGVGVVVTVVLYSQQFAGPLEQLAMGFSQLNRVKASAKRVFAILDEEEEQDLPPIGFEKLKGEIEFSNVYFSYKEEEPLIEDMNIRVAPGQNIAIVGPTGAGKTTIVNLLLRFYDPQKGIIKLDGKDISNCSRNDIRGMIGMVLQDTWLFRGTIAENVAYGKESATEAEIESACVRAHCDHFIRTMPEGYQTQVGEDTSNLSGGQKQLLTIARAILADRPILILDEATSNVDTRTELMIQDAMDELMKGKTTFVIAHRLSTIVGADLILVMDHGKIVEQGTHAQLLDKKGFYHKLFTSQYDI